MGKPHFSRPPVAPKGKGKELPRDEASTPLPVEPRNRRERRAREAWLRSKKVGDDGLTNAEREAEGARYLQNLERSVNNYLISTETHDDQA